MASLGSLICVLFFLITTTVAEIRFSEIRSDGFSTIPLDEFGFTHTGSLELNVTQILYDDQTLKNTNTDLSQIGFFLSSRDSWLRVREQIADGDLKCPLKSDFITVVFTFDKLQSSESYFSKISVINPNQLTLLFGNCVPDLKISMNVRSEMYNIDSKSNSRDYLSAAQEQPLTLEEEQHSSSSAGEARRGETPAIGSSIIRISSIRRSAVCIRGFPVWLKYVLGISFRTDNEPFKAAMQGFTQKIVQMMNLKSENLYESQGGPIILSQDRCIVERWQITAEVVKSILLPKNRS